MFDPFQHYLSYGSTDQQTIRELSSDFTGLVVPGTIAAFQAEGTKGFVLSLSARSNQPYVIDSRFPLFQNQLRNPKKSHGMLADVLGVPSLINRDFTPSPQDLTEHQINTISSNWIAFNAAFDEVSTKTFDKYAARLNEPVLPENREEPTYILPPYVMVDNVNDGWLDVSNRLWESSCYFAHQSGVLNKLHRVIAAKGAECWGRLASMVEQKQIVAWVSNLNEFAPNSDAEFILYGESIKQCRSRGQSVFALYGGFLSVLFSRYGLTGSSHGIGFGEHRDWVELPSSGAPPARYYVPMLHRYVGVEVAELLWQRAPEIMACDCLECNGRSPQALDYHALMRHSVRVRSLEIEHWVDLPTASVVAQLRSDHSTFGAVVRQLSVPSRTIQRIEETCQHLPMWIRIMETLG